MPKETGNVIQLHTAASPARAEHAVVADHYEAMLVQHRLAQVAYYARDIMAFGEIQPGTEARVDNELTGLAVEKLGSHYTTSFTYHVTPRGLTAEDGELMADIFSRGHDVAVREAQEDRRLTFRAVRAQADVAHVNFLNALTLDPKVPTGTCVVIKSPSPSSEQLGVHSELLEEHNYRPDEGMAVVWVATKLDHGLRLQTVNLFNAEPAHLAQSVAEVSGQPVPLSGREEMVWDRTMFLPAGMRDIAKEIQQTFDTQLSSQAVQTYHGLPLEQAQLGGESLVENQAFIGMKRATNEVMKQIAHSLVDGELRISPSYLSSMLELRRQSGEAELTGEARAAVAAVLGGNANEAQFVTAMQLAYTAAASGLWATLRMIYDGGEVDVPHNSEQAVFDAQKNLQHHLSEGTVEYGCPGDSSSAKSIFELTGSDLFEAFFSTSFVTNCPLCDEKGVVATKRGDTISCGDCGGAVEACTGRVVIKPKLRVRKRVAAKEATAKVFTIYDIFSKQKTSKPTAKREKMAA